jgi:hypothetical protein
MAGCSFTFNTAILLDIVGSTAGERPVSKLLGTRLQTGDNGSLHFSGRFS